jgi:hypothetical protein
MSRRAENEDMSHEENRSIRNSAGMTGDQNRIVPDQQVLDQPALADLIQFFKTLDRWDREDK